MLQLWLSERWSHALVGLAYFGAVALAHLANRPIVWLLLAVAICTASLLLWRADHRRMRAIEDTPTARIASAQQGRAELLGKAAALPGQALVSPYSGLPCVWVRHRLERFEDNKWAVVSQGRTDQPFMIDDGSGRALIDPDGAEITTDDVRRSTRAGQRWTEWLLVPGARLYALGEFASIGNTQSDAQVREDVGVKLTEWKQDQASLLARFDVDGNGEIDMREWALARNAATREVRSSHEELRTRAPTHVLRKPTDGGPFLVSAHAPDTLAQHHRRWAIAHFAFAVAALAVTLWALFQYPSGLGS